MPAAKTHRALALFAVVSANFMIAIEATIVSTAMPQIVGQLGGLSLYSWVFAAFLLAQTATTVLSGLSIFLVGSLLCGVAWSMPSMIAFRLIQGFGAGAIMPTTMTIVGDLYPAHERGKVQGYLASVWALSALLGPVAGGLIVQNISWAWIFWINIPLGLLAAALFTTYLHETLTHKAAKVEHLNAGLFALAIAAIMADLTALSTSSAREIAALSAFAVVAAAAFVWRERVTAEPMISLELWGRRPIAAANAASLLGGMIMVGLTTFLPVYVQGVMGQSALAAGFALSAMVMGWPIGATISPRLWKRVGPQPVLRAGAAMVPLGALVFIFLRPDSSPSAAAPRPPISSPGALARRARLLRRRAGHGLSQRLLDRADSGDREMVRARQRHGLLSLRPEPRQHLRRDAVRRRAECRPRRRRLRRPGDVGAVAPFAGRARPGRRLQRRAA